MGRYLIFSDVHENYRALEKLLDQYAGGCNEIWFLGDAVGHYAKDQDEVSEQYLNCLALLECKRVKCLIGNWEFWIANPQRDDDPKEIDGQGNHKDVLRSARAVLQTQSSLLDFVKSWKWEGTIENTFSLMHASPLLNPYDGSEKVETRLKPDKAASLVRQIFLYNLIPTKHFIFGHTHLPGWFSYSEAGHCQWRDFGYDEKPKHFIEGVRYAINPGTLDCENNHSQPRTALILDTDRNTYQYIVVE